MRTILLTINAAVFIAAFAPIAAACDDVAPSPASAVYIPRDCANARFDPLTGRGAVNGDALCCVSLRGAFTPNAASSTKRARRPACSIR